MRQAVGLLEAARVLVEALATPEGENSTELSGLRDIGCMGGALLLMGLAVENAFKAVWVHRNPPSLKNGRIKPSQLGGGKTGHSLLILSRQIGLTLSKDEETVLQRFEAYTKWLGKYRVSLSEGPYNEADTKGYRVLADPDDLRVAHALVARAQEEVGVFFNG